jgi:hypothetical protein
MIETAIMVGSLLVMGYAFYISSRMLWSFKSEKDTWRWLYTLVSGFIVFTFFLLGIVTFSFMVASFISQSIFNLINVVVGIFFLASAGLIVLVIRYHLSVMGSTAVKSAEIDLNKKTSPKEAPKIKKELDNIKKETPIGESELSRVAIRNELKMLEIRNKIRKIQRSTAKQPT